jgi:UDP-GlcNAc3NAcA epimerase
MKKVITIIGARPQFVKEAAVSPHLRERFQEIIIHTGQHYDENMSKIFFEDMKIPAPDYNLEVGSGSHAEQTGQMMAKIEAILLEEQPDYLVVYGDTNSTLAGALTAAKLHIPVGHIEAGLRSFNRKMPEEINRIVTDKISTQLFCPTQNAVNLLKSEGISHEVHLSGDVMLDVMHHFLPMANAGSNILEGLALTAGNYHLMTIHRAENSDDTQRLTEIFSGLSASPLPVIFPMHPRMKAIFQKRGLSALLEKAGRVKVIEPVGFLDMIALEGNAKKIITDSGGVQKEAFFLKKPCITMRDETEWTETVKDGYNVITGADKTKIADAILNFEPTHEPGNYFGDGRAGLYIAKAIEDHLK